MEGKNRETAEKGNPEFSDFNKISDYAFESELHPRLHFGPVTIH